MVTHSPKEGPGWFLAERRRCGALWGVAYPFSPQSPTPVSSPLPRPSPNFVAGTAVGCGIQRDTRDTKAREDGSTPSR